MISMTFGDFQLFPVSFSLICRWWNSTICTLLNGLHSTIERGSSNFPVKRALGYPPRLTKRFRLFRSRAFICKHWLYDTITTFKLLPSVTLCRHVTHFSMGVHWSCLAIYIGHHPLVASNFPQIPPFTFARSDVSKISTHFRFARSFGNFLHSPGSDTTHRRGVIIIPSYWRSKGARSPQGGLFTTSDNFCISQVLFSFPWRSSAKCKCAA